MASRKIVENIDIGLTNRSRLLGLTASAFQDLDLGHLYRINYHYDGMPAHKSRTFNTLDELEAAMRQFEPDLRKWSVATA